jgi:hypothetical protein
LLQVQIRHCRSIVRDSEHALLCSMCDGEKLGLTLLLPEILPKL